MRTSENGPHGPHFPSLSPPGLANLAGDFARTVDFGQLCAIQLVAGTPVHFQAWSRDPSARGVLFDLPDGLQVDVLP